MKKLRKSLSFATKVMLAFGLLISNLSSLSFVFAAEVKTEITVVDDMLNIKYLDELADDVESVKVNVYENYTYLDETFYVDEDGDFFAVSFENEQFTKMRIFGLPYKDAPQQLRRYYDEEHIMIHVPTEKVIECLGPKTTKAWVRSQYSFCDYEML